MQISILLFTHRAFKSRLCLSHTRRTNRHSACHTHGVHICTLLPTKTAKKSPCLPHPRRAYLTLLTRNKAYKSLIIIPFSTHMELKSPFCIPYKRCTNHHSCLSQPRSIHIFTLLSTYEYMAYKPPLSLKTPGVRTCESPLFLPLLYCTYGAQIAWHRPVSQVGEYTVTVKMPHQLTEMCNGTTYEISYFRKWIGWH